MVQKFILLTVLLMLLTANPAIAGSSAKMDLAGAAAREWLVLVDAGAYGRSWDNAARYFKDTVKPEQWQRSLEAARTPLGRQISRTIKSRIYRTALPGAPDGEYVVIQFKTVFENKAAAIETVTPMLETDGTWRVAGYYIR